MGDGDYAIDIDDQAEDNYEYDAIGNLIKDVAEGIDNIEWTVYGKIRRIEKSGDPNGVISIDYSYDASGNRISKKVSYDTDEVKITWYVRDASGNVMAVYESVGSGDDFGEYSLELSEQHLYGTLRLGIVKRNLDVRTAFADTGSIVSFTRGLKSYELSNHLGNVLVTISDKKSGVEGNVAGTIVYYESDVISAQDYYPGGMLQPNRSYAANNSYRYGFNGKEKDNEMYGGGNAYDFGARVYDPRVGRWFAVDPMRKLAPDETPYRFGHGNPILYKDPNGKWEEDGHYWTVYALGIAMGLSKTNAQAIAAKAEYYDHHVGG